MSLHLRELRRTSAARSILAALVLGLLALGVAACDDAEDDEALDADEAPLASETGGATAPDDGTATDGAGAETYEVTIDELNGSGVSGTATLEMRDGTLMVTMQADGLTADQDHPQHIHRPTGGATGSCPTEDADTNGDGVISLEEGAPAYGPVVLPLEPFTTAPGGSIDFTETYDTVPADAMPLEGGVIVLHGMEQDGEYVATLPVGCGTIG